MVKQLAIFCVQKSKMQLLTSEEGTNVRLAVETLEELDWCLDQVILASD